MKNFSESKAWIKQFLFVRCLFDGPKSHPLYQYQISDDEYAELPTMLKQSIQDLENPTCWTYWSAAFCLFVAEKYRRDYDGSNLGWSWRGFEKPLVIKLPTSLHGRIVKQGLNFWNRPIRARANGYDYLGSLFDEGGLPWRLIQSETHGFGRAVRGAIANYYRVKELGGDMVSLVANYANYFPQTFRTHEKFLLIASVVEWLMGLAETYQLSTLENPTDHLDEKAPDWRRQSPLPLGEKNARDLINEWLKDAGKSREEKKRLEADQKNYTCEHWLKGPFSDWLIKADVFLPAEVEIQLDEQRVQSTRLEIAFYEGDRLLQRSGIAYGKVNDDRSKITAKINSRISSITRSHVELPLTVQFLSNGQCIHACYIDGSEIEYASLPMVFVEEADDLRLLSTASTVIPTQKAVVRIPSGMSAKENQHYEVLGEDQDGGQWVGVTSDTTLSGLGSKVVLLFDSRASIEKPLLSGTTALYSTLPNVVYRGWPRVKASQGKEHRLLANGVPLQFDYQRNEVGSFALTIQGDAGETLLRRKIGVLPRDLRILSTPQSSNTEAKILLKTSQNLKIQLADETLHSKVKQSADGYGVTLAPLQGRPAPESVRLAVRDGLNPGEPVILRLPYPKTGVQVFDDTGEEFLGTLLSLDRLIEMSMTLTPRPDTREQFFVSLELICPELPNFRRYYPFPATNGPKKISLYAFLEDIQQMLGTSSNQDAIVRIRVETDRILKQLQIVRYDARLQGPNAAGRVEVVTDVLHPPKGPIKVSGMRLDESNANPVEVPERSSEGVGMGVYEIPNLMMKNGPWLLFPPEESSVRFRPTVWCTNDSGTTEESAPATLHNAAKQFHPIHNPQPFAVAISAMANDLSHSGWGYLRALKDNYANLPLSAFESWKALASNNTILATAVFRLELDSAFCRRLSNELAIIWETVTVKQWISAMAASRRFLLKGDISETFSENLISERVASVSGIIPCLAHIESYGGNVRGKANEEMVCYALKNWYQALRQNHADDQRWPQSFEKELALWADKQSLPQGIKQLADVRFARAVAFIPVFMAAVTAGKAELTDLTDRLPELRFAVRVLSDFDLNGWYEPTYSLVLSLFCSNQNKRELK